MFLLSYLGFRPSFRFPYLAQTQKWLIFKVWFRFLGMVPDSDCLFTFVLEKHQLYLFSLYFGKKVSIFVISLIFIVSVITLLDYPIIMLEI